RDLRTPARGVFSGFLDVLWDSNKALVTASDLTNALTFGADYQGSKTGNASTPGLIDEGGAFAGFTELGGGAKELFSVPMRATAAGTLIFSADPADDLVNHPTDVYDDPQVDVKVPPAQIHYGAVTIQVASTFNAVGDAFTAQEDSQNNSFNP